MPWPTDRRIIGTKVPRLDGPDKSTGRAKYSYDYFQPGMLFGKILRSPYAKARIVSIDVSAAEKMPGVKAVEVIQKIGAVFKIDVDAVAELLADVQGSE